MSYFRVTYAWPYLYVYCRKIIDGMKKNPYANRATNFQRYPGDVETAFCFIHSRETYNMCPVLDFSRSIDVNCRSLPFLRQNSIFLLTIDSFPCYRQFALNIPSSVFVPLRFYFLCNLSISQYASKLSLFFLNEISQNYRFTVDTSRHIFICHRTAKFSTSYGNAPHFKWFQSRLLSTCDVQPSYKGIICVFSYNIF